MYPELTDLSRAIDIKVPFSSMRKEFGFWRALWGMDVFINDIPVLKSMIAANIIVWLVLFI